MMSNYYKQWVTTVWKKSGFIFLGILNGLCGIAECTMISAVITGKNYLTQGCYNKHQTVTLKLTYTHCTHNTLAASTWLGDHQERPLAPLYRLYADYIVNVILISFHNNKVCFNLAIQFSLFL